jgi:hypothetical protein
MAIQRRRGHGGDSPEEGGRWSFRPTSAARGGTPVMRLGQMVKGSQEEEQCASSGQILCETVKAVRRKRSTVFQTEGRGEMGVGARLDGDTRRRGGVRALVIVPGAAAPG